MQQRHHVQLRPEHRGDVVTRHVQQRDRATAERCDVDAGQRRKVGTEAVEQRAHRRLVRRIGGCRHQCGAGRRQAGGQLVEARTRVARYRDDGARARVGKLLDQVRSDVAGRADNQIAAVLGQFGRSGRRRVSLVQPRHAAQAGPVDNLVFVVGGLSLVHDVAGGQAVRHRLVDIDDAAPEFGVLECERAAQTPQHRVSGVGAVAFADRLGVAGEQIQPRRHAHLGDGSAQPSCGVEILVSRLGIELAADHLGRVEHVGHSGEGVGDRRRVGAFGQQ